MIAYRMAVPSLMPKTFARCSGSPPAAKGFLGLAVDAQPFEGGRQPAKVQDPGAADRPETNRRACTVVAVAMLAGQPVPAAA